VELHRSFAIPIAGCAVAFFVASGTPTGASPNHAPSRPSAPAAVVAAHAATVDQPDRVAPAAVGPSPTPATPAGPTPTPSPTVPTAPVVSTLAAGGIPQIALNAYKHAAALLATSRPTCGIDWSLLAGIGRVESNHGRFGGATLHADGTSAPHIIGIALDGSRSALIRDTDHGVLDGDLVYDRAVGPMQFIPSTWSSWGADGNGDGRRDPFNIMDAALAAARYLCAAGGDLRTVAGQSRAVLAYNHSDAYLVEVLALAGTYATGVAIAAPTLPPAPPALPPVDPGPPAAAQPTPTPTPTPTGSGTSSTPGSTTPTDPAASPTDTSPTDTTPAGPSPTGPSPTDSSPPASSPTDPPPPDRSPSPSESLSSPPADPAPTAPSSAASGTASPSTVSPSTAS